MNPASQSHTTRSRRLRSIPVLLAMIAALAAAPALPRSASPPRGSDAPPIRLKDLNASSVDTSALAPRSLVLIFGEVTNDATRSACTDVLDTIAEPSLAPARALPILIVAQDATPAQLKDEAARGRFPPLILHDPTRETFGAYRILVVPTIVVVNPKGKVVHSSPAFVPRFKELLAESLLVAAGKESDAQFEQSLDPRSPAMHPEAVRADHLAHLGEELTRHALYDLAEARFADALKLDPSHLPARLGLASLMLRQDRLRDAEPIFASILATIPDSVDATLGLAEIQIRRSADGLSEPEAALSSVLTSDPKHPRAHYLMGRILEARGDTPGALAHYRRSAELLLDR
ncbi:MAG: tetratricopeptide repeat protein [Phycisphaerales bacterium]